MTPNMIKALSDALAADGQGGLKYTVAGWQRPAAIGEHHSFVTIRALQRDGYLHSHQKDTRMSITVEGRGALHHSRVSKKKSK